MPGGSQGNTKLPKPREITLLERIPQHKRHCLHLWFCFFDREIPILSTLALPNRPSFFLALSKPDTPNKIYSSNILWWRWAESNRRPEQFQLTSYDHNCSVWIRTLSVCYPPARPTVLTEQNLFINVSIPFF